MNRNQEVRKWFGRRQGSDGRKLPRRPRGTRLRVEELEPRCVPSFIYLASFNTSNGSTPLGTLVEDSTGTLYGTCSAGGSTGSGTLFAEGSGAINAFGNFGVSSGTIPSGGLIEDSAGNFFGTTQTGGNQNSGTVFEYLRSTASLKTLWNFADTTGNHPYGGVIEDSSGNWYGTTYQGGTSNDGIVFKLNKFLTGLTTLATFTGANGANPYGGLVLDSSGNFYGTAYNGGSAGDGTVFEVVSGSGTVTTLATFTGANGAHPGFLNLVMDSSGNLFGTTYGGGAAGFGTVFEVVKSSGTVTTLATFDNTNGANPYGGLVEDASGNLFGTTYGSGTGNTPYGTVFEVKNGSGAVTTLSSFNNVPGAYPAAGLVIDSSGNLFGTTSQGGTSNVGTVFELAVPTITTSSLPAGDVSTSYNHTINAYSGSATPTFSKSAGTMPPGLTLSTSGVLSGTPTTTGSYTFTVTVALPGGASGSQGYTVLINPALIIATTSLVAWTINQPGYNQTITASGGTSPTTFALTSGTLAPGLTLAGNGVLSGTPTTAGWYTFIVTVTDSVGGTASQAYTVIVNPPVTFNSGIILLASFNGSNGASPLNIGSLVEDSSGNLFGTAVGGGTANDGTIFEVLKGSRNITTLASFSGSNGANPYGGLLEDSSGNLFGTTKAGGAAGDGTVFELLLGSSTIMSLASFIGSNGASPYGGVIEDSSGNLYGTTYQGGSANDGTVFEWQMATGIISTLATFTGSNGANPGGGLVEDSAGSFFGTTSLGGSANVGTVFEIPGGTGPATTLASFTDGNGAGPFAALLQDTSGNLFGTTDGGGASNDGTVFEMQKGSGTITTLASFNGGNGAAPVGGLVEDSSGNLFGTTSGGNLSSGTVFEVQKGSGTATPLAAFGGANGAAPDAGLVEDSSGNLFGTASMGGASNFGTVFQVFTSPLIPPNWTVNRTGYSATIVTGGGTGALTYSTTAASLPPGMTLTSTGILSGTPTQLGTYSFTVIATDSVGASGSRLYTVTINPQVSIGATTLASCTSGAAFEPFGTPLVDSSGNLFGTTYDGGPPSPGYGTIFEVQKGTGTITPLATFNSTNGANPATGLVEDSLGNLFGTTSAGGSSSHGTVYEWAKATGTISTLATISASNGGSTGLAQDNTGNLFGATHTGGTNNDGTVFKVLEAGGAMTLLATFNGTNGANPYGAPLVDSSGNVFGTTVNGGPSNDGVVYEIPSGGSIIVLANFSGANGANPEGGLAQDANGNLFGTTANGGTANDGTIFELRVTPGSYSFSLLASFNGANGTNPMASLVVDSNGNLYGTTAAGGPTGDGTVFEFAQGTITTRAVLNSTGGVPGGLALDSSGILYGVTPGGGSSSAGMVFAVVPLATGTAGETNYNQTIPASGGTGPLTYSTLSFVPGFGSNGVLSDSSSPGTFTFTVTATDVTGFASSATFTFTINPPITLDLTTLASFNGTNGADPYGGLVMDSNGNLFGTTRKGGTGAGVLFEIARGSGTMTTVANFGTGLSGGEPTGTLIEDSNGNLFGTTPDAVFEVPRGSNTITGLATFNVTNGDNAIGGLVMDSNGNLFGTTELGGTGFGTVFELASGSSTITDVATFNGGNGSAPFAGLAMDLSGNLFGTTFGGGTADYGTIFEVQSGSSTITTLASFDGITGGHPEAGVILDGQGNIFGCNTGLSAGAGSVIEIVKGTTTMTTLATFAGVPNGGNPYGTLLEDSSGNLFGTTGSGGGGVATGDAGSVFELAKGSSTVTDLVDFNGINGAGPLAGLVEDSSGNYFGTTGFGGASSMGTVFELSPFLPSVTAGLAYRQTIPARGGTGTLTFSVPAATLPPGLTLSSAGVLSGMTTMAGSYSFPIMVTDSLGVSSTATYLITINPGRATQYLVTVQGPSTVQAGNSFGVTIQAADPYGNPVVNYSGPTTVAVSINPTSAASSFPTTASVNGSGFGFIVGNLQKAGVYTISAKNVSLMGSSPSLTVIPGPATRLAFAAQPVNTPTGVSLPAVMVQILDAYGNVVTSDNSDQVTLAVASGPGTFLVGSTSAVTASSGVATFTNLTLVKPGSYTLSEQVPSLYSGPNSNVFTVAPLQVLPGSFAGTPSGFSLQFTAPYLVNSTTPVIYGQGFGATAPVPSLTLTQTKDGSGNPAHNVIAGSLVLNTASNSLTFVATNTSLETNNHAPLLPDGTYSVVLHSSAANDGFQALNSGGGFLDGLNNGTAGSGDYTATFTVSAAVAHDDVLWVPATSDGPGLPFCAPGKNQVGGGYPVYLSDSTGTVSSVHATLTYNPALLTVTPTSTPTFTVTVPTAGTAVLLYTGPSLPTGSQTPIGFITATVPPGTISSPIPYKAKDLLHLSGTSLNGGTVPVVTSDGLHVVAYVGDADGNGAYSSNDSVLITRALLATDTGFVAYPLVDPLIVSDTDGAGFIPADAALQANEAGVAFPTANLPIPPIPSGVHFQATVFHAEALASLSTMQPPARRPVAGQTVSVPLMDFFITDRKILDLYFARLENA